MLAFALLLGIASTGAASADKDAVPTAIVVQADGDAFAAALDLLSEMDIEHQMMEGGVRMANLVMDTQMKSLEDAGISPPEALVGQLKTLIFEHIKATTQRMMPTARADFARVYARHFSAAELRQLKKLQSEPVMRKMQGIAPTLMSEAAQIGVKASAAGQPELQRRIQETVEQWFRNHPEEAQTPAS